MGRTGEGESARAFKSPFRVRICKDKIGVLPWSESEAGFRGVEPERHRVPGDSLPIDQFHLMFRHYFSLSLPKLRSFFIALLRMTSIETEFTRIYSELPHDREFF